jgi:hypothetical protein
MKERRLQLEPKFTKSNTEAADDSLANERTLNVLPNCA